MKLLSVQQIKEWDRYTILHEPVSSLGLMERASIRCFDSMLDWLKTHEPGFGSNTFQVVCGTGNNGGDGLVIARKLQEAGIAVNVFVLGSPKNGSDEFQLNLSRYHKAVKWMENEEDFQSLPDSGIWIDAIFGIGLNKPLEGLAAKLVSLLNSRNGVKLSVDLPSGLHGDIDTALEYKDAVRFQPDCTFTFQVPKTSLLFPETGSQAGEVRVIDISLHPSYVNEINSDWQFTEEQDLKEMPVSRFAHKGNKGHALIVAGSFGKLGAAVLASKAALRAGCGLLTAHIPKVGYTVFQTAVPEIMVDTDDELYEIRNFPLTEKYQAVGVGPGLGLHPLTVKAFGAWVTQINQPLVIDADALNAAAEYRQAHLEFRFPKGSILTPHPKEFERLFGRQDNSLQRLDTALTIAKEQGVIIVLKGANTAVVEPGGKVFFNSSGSNLLATAGSGDVLTGILTSLLAQGLSAVQAAITGVYWHGLLAEKLRNKGYKRIIAGDLVNELRSV